jgi:hypothetical protein
MPAKPAKDGQAPRRRKQRGPQAEERLEAVKAWIREWESLLYGPVEGSRV